MVTNACVNVIDVAPQFEGVKGSPQHDPLLTSDPTFVTPTSSFTDGDGEIIFPCFFLEGLFNSPCCTTVSMPSSSNRRECEKSRKRGILC